MACTCGPGQECKPLKPGCWGYQDAKSGEWPAWARTPGDAETTTLIPSAPDPQIAALVRASGHTVADSMLILSELNSIGWTIMPITGFLATLKEAR